jgi:hypothetical protein
VHDIQGLHDGGAVVGDGDVALRDGGEGGVRARGGVGRGRRGGATRRSLRARRRQGGACRGRGQPFRVPCCRA